MDNLKFGKFIADARKNNGLTQAELAEKLNVTDKTISKWECGRGFPDIKLIDALADSLKVSVAELMQCEKVQGAERTREETWVNLHKGLTVKRIFLTMLCIFCTMGTVLATNTGTGIFQYIREFAYYNGFVVYEICIGIIIWQIFVKDKEMMGLEESAKAKKNITYLFAFSCIVNIAVLMNMAQITINIFQATLNGELYRGMDPGQIGPHMVTMLRLTQGVLVALCVFCIFFGKKYSKYLTIAAMQHVSGVYALVAMECMMRSLDLSQPEGGWTAQLMLHASGISYLEGMGIMAVMMLILMLKKKRINTKTLIAKGAQD